MIIGIGGLSPFIPMLLEFKIDKAIAATAYVIERQGGTEDMFPLVKKLYYADRSALIGWGNSITGDAFASLKKGPIVSGIYDLLKGIGPVQHQIQWNNVIQRREPYAIVLRKEPNKGVLSEREKEVLEESRVTINAIRGSIPKWFHNHCPEWEDPGDSSIPIDPSTILRVAKKSEEEIRRIEESNEEIRMLNLLLGVK
ncbi:MAG: Panacea domain-containing protein [Candidatus Sulfotelmatobacter sp.]